MARILVIRLGALGDFVLSFPAFAAIRAHHAGDHITLLTTAPFAALAADSPWFDHVEVDARPQWYHLAGLWRLARQLRGFDFVYDLQTSGRSSRYFILAGRPPWSGIAPGCSHPDADPNRNNLHTLARQRGQLADAGVPPAEPDLAWLRRGGPLIEGAYALVIPGTSMSQGGAKKWPTARFAGLASGLSAIRIRPVIVGTRAEAGDAACIRAACPAALDLTGQTSIQDLAGLAARARLAVGGDTGPLHLAAMMGCPVVALFSKFSNPALAAPVGHPRILAAPRLDEVDLATVLAAVADLTS
jgi:ADP-heptose:LPS heptosyltransferase